MKIITETEFNGRTVRLPKSSIRQQKRARAAMAVRECHEATHQAKK
jgi:hypothetical protein